MADSRRSAKKEDVINIFDLVNGDPQIGDCYEIANTIIIREKLSEQEVKIQNHDYLLRMRKSYLTSR